MEAAAGEPATMLGSPRPSSARRATRIAVSENARTAIVGLLEGLKPRIEAHFNRALDGFEAPQFLRYGPGDYFVAHQDGNTPLVHDESRFRKVSVVIFVSAPDAYSGGSLVLHADRRSRSHPLRAPWWRSRPRRRTRCCRSPVVSGSQSCRGTAASGLPRAARDLLVPIVPDRYENVFT